MDEQARAEAAFRGMVQALGFDTKGLFDGLHPQREAVARLFPLISRGERVMLAFLLTVYEPALKRELLGDFDVLANLQAVDARGRGFVAEWTRAPYFVAVL